MTRKTPLYSTTHSLNPVLFFFAFEKKVGYRDVVFYLKFIVQTPPSFVKQNEGEVAVT